MGINVVRTTREEIAEFQTAFKRPLNNILQENLSVEDRILLAKLLLEEAVEYVTKGLKLKVYIHAFPTGSVLDDYGSRPDEMEIEHVGIEEIDVIECADGLGDVNVVAHFCAHWHGMNLDRVTSEIHRSNMSKLGEDGQPIINGETPGYRHLPLAPPDDETGYDPTKPIGKILKGPNYTIPDLQPILAAGNWLDLPVLHVDESKVSPTAALDHCADHPDQTSENCEGGYGLAGGGVGMYYICGTCGNVFGKTDDGADI